ncbi:MAG: Uma2 family endonuclease [Planctomycetaceae bacterium]|nr:Uma2 family endonuclease [Planctomycetaceae bacterium]
MDRIRLDPFPGTASVNDVVRLHDKEGLLCELIDGILVEKPMGFEESTLASILVEFLSAWVRKQNLGLVTSPDGMVEIQIDLVRIPDVSYISWNRLPGRRRPKKAVPRVVPNLVAEILSKSNTRTEMKRKRVECFDAGVELFWEIDPKKRVVRVYTAADAYTTLSEDHVLDGGAVLPGFELPLSEFFGELDRHG